jgi:hypothetical protein
MSNYEQNDEYGEPTFVDDAIGIDRPTFPAEMATAGMGAKYGEVEKPWHPVATEFHDEATDEYGQPTFAEDQKGTTRPTFPVEMARAGMGRTLEDRSTEPWTAYEQVASSGCLICGGPIDVTEEPMWNPANTYVPKICFKCKRAGVYMGSELPQTSINKTYLNPEQEKRWRP